MADHIDTFSKAAFQIGLANNQDGMPCLTLTIFVNGMPLTLYFEPREAQQLIEEFMFGLNQTHLHIDAVWQRVLENEREHQEAKK